MTDFPIPAIPEHALPFWEAAEKSQLRYMACNSCAHSFLPARTECPNCLAADLEWRMASGKAQLISWVIYHRAFHPAFADRLPYTVALVQLEEGPRMISNIVEPDPDTALTINLPLFVRFQDMGNLRIPVFSRQPKL
ncbi:Zn-ribbon domain-containing OB-fold protein [Hyphomonas chukchiensis]|uniref:DUF35 domain-containing protein n=1 Tax=Hyphomonas chukchiensis TaxID=1280947 RepID=A0A062UPB8_9PROT|nr:OB-fold domain-containing protein [Hyphomonas chukchiensis]KCZ58688.1 hypothetical protein HY30_15900 [Hyphomonas chukchiensis]|tara:strand:+ start:101 stop:511 length:411 start_codon:yes stop_codon:yes gene_type:complete